MKNLLAKLTLLPLLAAFAITLTSGCHYFSDEFGEEKMIPNPLPDQFPYELTGKAYKIWIGNEMQIKSDEHTSYVLLQGVNNPDTGDEREDQAIAQLWKLSGEGEIRIVVQSRDQLERVIGQIYAGQSNVNLEMIRSGWGQYDGSQFEQADLFQQTQRQAQAARRGIWAKGDLERGDLDRPDEVKIPEPSSIP